MVGWIELLLPAALSAVLVFIASSLIHIVFKLHDIDYHKLSNEDEVRAAINRGSPAPAQYVIPHCKDSKQAQSPEMVAKFEEGPVAVLFVRPRGGMKIGPFLGAWFVYTLVVSLLAGYVAHAALGPGAPYLSVFQLVGASAWLAHSWATPTESIWMGKPWGVTIRHMLDGLVYAALTAGTYAWLWPEGPAA
jgi:hypothetical protein